MTKTDEDSADDTSESAVFQLYKLYLSTAEKTSDRRGTANQWLLSVNSAIVGLYGFIAQGKSVGDASLEEVWRWAIPFAGILACVTWAALLSSYAKLNEAKFKVLQDLERSLPAQVFANEETHYKADNRLDLSKLEVLIPWSFVALYALLMASTF